MSQENVEIVRQPIAVRAQSRRRLEERLAVRFPRVLALVARAVMRLPPHSRLRQGLVRRTMQLGLEAINRGDYDAGFSNYHADVELTLPEGIATLFGESGTRGRQDRMRFQQRWSAEWGEFRFEPEELIDFSDGRLLTVGHITGSGLSSRAGVDSDWAVLHTISTGRVIREQVFMDHVEALEAAGLGE